MSNRLNPRFIINGHLKGLRNRSYRNGRCQQKTDFLTLILVIIVIPSLFGLGLSYNISSLDIPKIVEIALSWTALLSAGLLAIFSLLASYKSKLTDRRNTENREFTEQHLRDLVDETVSHTLVGIMDSITFSVFSIFLLLDYYITKIIFGFAVGWLFGHTVSILYLVTTRLYSTYVQIESVDDYVNGFNF